MADIPSDDFCPNDGYKMTRSIGYDYNKVYCPRCGYEEDQMKLRQPSTIEMEDRTCVQIPDSAADKPANGNSKSLPDIIDDSIRLELRRR